MNLITTFLRGQSAFQRLRVSPSAQAIYHTLLRLANQNGWKTATIRTSVGAIRRLANLTSHANIRQFVNELIDAELITVKIINRNTDSAFSRVPNRQQLVDITILDDTASPAHKKQQQAAKSGNGNKPMPTLGGDFS